MASQEEFDSVMTILTRRGKIMARVVDGISERGELREEFDESRSTIYRGLDQLADHGLIREANGRYTPTTYGHHLFREYEKHKKRFLSIMEVQELLMNIPTNELLAPSVLVDAEIFVSKKPAPISPIENIRTMVRGATKVTGFSPVILPQYINLFREEFKDEMQAAEFIVDESVIEHLQSKGEERFQKVIAMDEVTLLALSDQLPFGLFMVETPTPQMCVVLHGSTGELRGVIQNDSKDAVAWAKSAFEQYRDAATMI